MPLARQILLTLTAPLYLMMYTLVIDDDTIQRSITTLKITIANDDRFKAIILKGKIL